MWGKVVVLTVLSHYGKEVHNPVFCFSCSAAMEWDSESVKSEDVFKQPGNPEAEMKTQPSTPQSQAGVRLHEFVSKTVRMPFLWEKEIAVVHFFSFL